MWESPTTWYLDADGNVTTEPTGNQEIIRAMPLDEAVRLGIAEKDGTPIDPKAVKKAQRAAKADKAKEE